MMYLLGAVALDTRPLSADALTRTSSGSLVAKPVMGGRQRKENTGEGDDEITITGSLLPARIGGMSELEILHAMRRAGSRFPLMRGDGMALGWFAIKTMTEQHDDLQKNGVGFQVVYSVTLEQADPQTGDGQTVISALLSLFALGSAL
jgi:uncharacterized protein